MKKTLDPAFAPSRPGSGKAGPSSRGPGALSSRKVSAERRSDRRAPSRAVIVSAVRTPMGSFNSVFSNVPATKLGSVAIAEALKRINLPGDRVDEVYMGCVISAGLGQAPARQASIGAGIPNSVGATTANKVCGSSSLLLES